MISFSSILSSIWHVFDVIIPGTGFTFKSMYMGMLVVGISISVIKSLFDAFVRKAGRGVRSRGGNSRNVKIDKSRKGDEI